MDADIEDLFNFLEECQAIFAQSDDQNSGDSSSGSELENRDESENTSTPASERWTGESDAGQECPECGEEMPSPRDLHRHMQQHARADPQTDDHFERELTCQESARHHMSTATEVHPFICNICQKQFIELRYLKKHIDFVHVNEASISCDQCPGKFKRKSDLRIHLRTHSGEKPYSCSLCNKRFTRSENLRKHTVNHLVSKPFSCDHCPAIFARRNQLLNHLTNHTGEKYFSCEICFKKFTRSYHLNLHMRIHTRDKPFSCGECFKTFSQKGQLTAHLRTKSGDRSFTCNSCPKKYAHASSLRNHMKKCHAMQSQALMQLSTTS